MNKRVKIVVAIATSALLAVNFYLLFGEKNNIMKSVYVEEYERMTSNYYSVELAKEALVAPKEMHTVYVGNDIAVDSWLVTEGDTVQVGDELVVLNTERAEGQRQIWEAESDALEQRKTDARLTIAKLNAERERAKYDNSLDESQTSDVTKNEDGVNVEVHVEISPEGSFASAIVAAELELADIQRQLIVLEAQLSQNTSRTAIISPVEGVIARVIRHGSMLAVDIYSSQKVIVTYAKENEWQHIIEGSRVFIQGDGIGEAVEGRILSVSTVPAPDDAWLFAYKTLDSVGIKNPLAYYEVRILTDTTLHAVPFGNDLNAMIIVKEAEEASSVPEKWLRNQGGKAASAMIIDHLGRAVEVEVSTPFTWNTRSVVTEGLSLGDIIIHNLMLNDYDYAPAVFLPMPTYIPTKEEWKNYGWRNYLRYMTLK